MTNSILKDSLGIDLARLRDDDVVQVPLGRLREALHEAFRTGILAGRHWKEREDDDSNGEA
ncbi:hypothetical protein LZC95_49980 [Pendulispora brunnea]|uniref:Uncharacterized protein n=1 Tax=Pendulispora brunnea TaxID=2905690 RepID=A0ABZ2KBS1_9BACT